MTRPAGDLHDRLRGSGHVVRDALGRHTPATAVPPTTSFAPRTISATATASVVTVKTKRTTTPGTYTVTVTGASGSHAHRLDDRHGQ